MAFIPKPVTETNFVTEPDVYTVSRVSLIYCRDAWFACTIFRVGFIVPILG